MGLGGRVELLYNKSHEGSQKAVSRYVSISAAASPRRSHPATPCIPCRGKRVCSEGILGAGWLSFRVLSELNGHQPIMPYGAVDQQRRSTRFSFLEMPNAVHLILQC